MLELNLLGLLILVDSLSMVVCALSWGLGVSSVLSRPGSSILGTLENSEFVQTPYFFDRTRFFRSGLMTCSVQNTMYGHRERLKGGFE